LAIILNPVYLFCCRGYLAPEYALLGQLTKKADVYSFGILMLEIISGKSSSIAAFDEDYLVLVEWVYFVYSQSMINIDLIQCMQDLLLASLISRYIGAHKDK